MTKINKKIISFLFLALAVVSVFGSSSITTNASDKYIDEDKNKNETIEKKLKHLKVKFPLKLRTKLNLKVLKSIIYICKNLRKSAKKIKKTKRF